MRIQNCGLAASVMRHAEIAFHNAFGRLFLTLLMMLLTAMTAGAWSAREPLRTAPNSSASTSATTTP